MSSVGGQHSDFTASAQRLNPDDRRHQYLLPLALCPRKIHLVASLWSKHYLKDTLRRLIVNLAQAGFKDELIRV